MAEQIAEPAAEQQEPAEGEQVRVHDPRQRRRRRTRGLPGSTAARRRRSSRRGRSSGRRGRGPEGRASGSVSHRHRCSPFVSISELGRRATAETHRHTPCVTLEVDTDARHGARASPIRRRRETRPRRSRPRRGRRRDVSRPRGGFRGRARGEVSTWPSSSSHTGSPDVAAPLPRTCSTRRGSRWSSTCAPRSPGICRSWSADAPRARASRAARSRQVGAHGVLCLAFPLLPPRRSGGKPATSRLSELDAVSVPTLVVQGERDPFGVPPASALRTVVTVSGDHSLRSDLPAVAAAVQGWLLRLVG